MARKIKTQTTKKRLNLIKLERRTNGKYVSYRLQLGCTKLIKKMFKDNVDLEKVRFYYVRNGRKLTLHFIQVQ